MICSLLNRDLGFVCRSVLGFLDRSISTAMGCFIGCFRVRDDRRHGTRSQPHLVADSSHPKLTEAVISQNRLSSLFLSEDKEESPSKENGSASVGTPNIDNQLKKEAKFLKACGTLAETPIEIRKASSKLDGSPLHGGESGSSKFHSWLPNASVEKLHLDNQIDQPPTPIKLSEERVMISASLEQTPSSGSVSNTQNRRVSFSSTEGSGTGSISAETKVHASDTPQLSATHAPYKCKSVRFDCDSDLSSSKGSSSENYSQNSKKDESPGNHSMSKPSPYPTPRKLSDEMQTPGTVFPAHFGNFPNGKTRIRSQYVYPVLNPVESVSQWNVLKEEDPNSHQLSGELQASLDQPENATPPKLKERAKETSLEEMKVEASLSSWLKPVQPNQGGNYQNFVGVSDRPRAARTPMDRPIIGMVAAHWNEEEPSRISPKWWDGNGIPNSTNKYKEDQKVSWHATPFEERLEKALSEESFISQRFDLGSSFLCAPVISVFSEGNSTRMSSLSQKEKEKGKGLEEFMLLMQLSSLC
ncbi:hypothetical protein TIFTF001_024109 [Ficus carica]|uniref:Protein JASON n=1 Tax=Ficus carica TaxID=3494 RepID=A0AA88ALL6_FICCA|nr:hypothetical protein TIFTF001_024109 [Ficus carica]